MPSRRPSGSAPAVALMAGGGCLALVLVSAQAAATMRPSGAAVSHPLRFVTAAAAAFAFYGGALLVLRCRGVALVPVLALAAAIQLAPLAQPLLLSHDALAYWAYGRVAAVDGGNPYRDPPAAFPADPATRSMDAAWRGTTSVYGPAFTAASEAVALAVGSSPRRASSVFKTVAALGVVVCAALAAALSRHRAFAAAAVGWNPLFALHFGGGGHNDSLMVALLLGALVLESRGRSNLGASLWAVAAGVKWIPLLLLPVRLADRRPGRRFGALAFLATAGLSSALAFVRYGTDWIGASRPLARAAAHGSGASVAGRLGFLGLPRIALLLLLTAGFVAVYAVLLRRARLRGPRLGLLAGALLVATPWILPWYVSWTLPLAAAEDDGAAVGLALGLSAYLLVVWPPM